MGRRWPWLVAAVLLIAAATALMLLGEEAVHPPPRADVNFPRRLRPEERERLERRRFLPAQPAPAPAKGEPPTPARPQDPVLAALASKRKRSAVVVEANAIRNSPIGQLLLDCLAARSRGRSNPVEEIKQRVGVDVLQDLDRVAMTEDGVLLSGHFENARWSEAFKDRATSSSYGEGATFYRMNPRTLRDGGTSQSSEVVATWKNQLLFVADSPEEAQAIIDRLEGRAPVAEPLITEQQTYGEIYGVLSAQDLAKILPPDQAALADRIRSAAERVELHVDTSKDVGIVAQIQGSDSSQVTDLGKSLGAALSLSRLKAQADGDQNVAEFLELARVVPDGDQFKLEMALPLALLEKHLAWCRDTSSPPPEQDPPAEP
jgi:hypothetical protein